MKRTKASDQPPAKRKSKIMNVKERKSLLKFLDSGDDTVLSAVVKDDLKQQLFADQLKKLTEALCTNDQLLTQLVACHRKCFGNTQWFVTAYKITSFINTQLFIIVDFLQIPSHLQWRLDKAIPLKDCLFLLKSRQIKTSLFLFILGVSRTFSISLATYSPRLCVTLSKPQSS